MNKIIAALTIALLIFFFSACGGGGNKAPSSQSAASTYALSSSINASTTSAGNNSTSSANSSPSNFSSMAASQSPDIQRSSNHSLSSASSELFGLPSSSASSSSIISTSSLGSAGSSTADLQTWWHQDFEENASTPVADNKVRRSTIYDVKVNTDENENHKQNSFVYMSIPRSGKGKKLATIEDGAEFAAEANLTMSWSSFLYKTDTWVQVDVKDGKVIHSLDEVRIRPTTLNFTKELLSPTSVRIKVPFNENGYRFSVELDAELMTSRSNQLGRSGKLTENPQDAIVHSEPRNALLIFAEPMLNPDQQSAWVPTSLSGSIYYPDAGELNLNNRPEQIIYFKPGIYTMPGNTHAQLPANVHWLYLAPGAYVKGAFEFSSGNTDYKLTGFGIISGEKYTYAADRKLGYAQSPGKCDDTCLRMLQFVSADHPQTLQVQGITLNEPPFNSFSVLGNTQTYPTHMSHYKQVGSWYYQTDGVEVYAGGSLKNAFFHANDDVLKMYHSNTIAENIVIWKGENGPVIQFGWASRNINNMRVQNVDVIHNRMYWKDQKSNTCIINSMDLYSETPLFQDRISLDHTIANVELRNIRSEGKNLCAMRFIALSNWQSITLNGLEIEEWNDLATDSQLSLFSARSTTGDHPQPLVIGTGTAGLNIENYKVAGKLVQSADESWKSNSHGRLNFSLNLFNNWIASGSEPATCIAQTIDFAKPADTEVSTAIPLSASASSKLSVSLRILSGEASIAGNILTTTQQRGLVTIAAEAGDEHYCHTRVIQTLTVVNPDLAPTEGRWIGAAWTSWNPGTIPMIWDAAEKLFTASVTLTAGTARFKFTDTDNWSGDDWGDASGAAGTAKKNHGRWCRYFYSHNQSRQLSYLFQPLFTGLFDYSKVK